MDIKTILYFHILPTILSSRMAHATVRRDENCTYEPFRTCEKEHLHIPVLERCLFVSSPTSRENQSTAESNCQERGMILLELRTEREATAVLGLLLNTTNTTISEEDKHYWLGIHYDVKSKSYLYNSDDSKLRLNDFRGGMSLSTIPGRQDLCVQTYLTHLVFTPTPCSTLYRYICEKGSDYSREKPMLRILNHDETRPVLQEDEIFTAHCTGTLFQEGLLMFIIKLFGDSIGTKFGPFDSKYKYTEARYLLPNNKSCARHGEAFLTLVADRKYDGGSLACFTYVEANRILKYCNSGDELCSELPLVVKRKGLENGGGEDGKERDFLLRSDFYIFLIILLWVFIVLSLIIILILLNKNNRKLFRTLRKRQENDLPDWAEPDETEASNFDKDEDQICEAEVVNSNTNVSRKRSRIDRWWRFNTDSVISTVVTTASEHK